MGPHHRLGTYVGFDFPSINRYLETHMRDTVNASPKDCEFDESLFPALGNELLQPKVEQKISWTTPTLSYAPSLLHMKRTLDPGRASVRRSASWSSDLT